MDSSKTGGGEQARLIELLNNPARFGPWCHQVRVLETHISYVLLTGRYAYKIKKAVNLGFLDFTTLPARHFYCDQELELNRRLAPEIYLDVVPITGTLEAPQVGGDGPAIEYAVKMREFSQDALLTRVLSRGDLSDSHVDQLAVAVAAFHGGAAVARAGSRFGSANEILELAVENFAAMEPLLEQSSDRAELASLRRWTEREHAARTPLFAERQRRGVVRECHGDLHLGNIALVDASVTLFDRIEFSERMRWGDVMADVAFLVMDLQDHKRPDFAARFLNGYLELTGDYDGLGVLRFYLVYRAMVRAKVACLRAAQTTDREARNAQNSEYREYLNFARRSSQPAHAGIVITRGPTGSGKTTVSQGFIEVVGGIRIRTDVERKRLHGLTPRARSGSALEAGLYSTAETERTYARLAGLARTIVRARYLVVVDGTFLRRRQREPFQALAADLDVPFVIVDCVARIQTLRERVEKRHRSGLDASEADTRVLDHQLRVAERITSDERALTVTYDTEVALESARQATSWRAVIDRLHLEVAANR